MMRGINVNIKGLLARIPSGGVGIELGVWKGGSSVKLLNSTNPKMLHLVDSWSVEPYKETTEWTWEEYIQRYQELTGGFTEYDFQRYYDQVYTEVKNNFKDYSNVKVWRMTTDDFFDKHCLTEKWKSTGGRFNHDSDVVHDVDWVYVDASHSYEGVTRDLENVLQIVKKDGKIFGDDYSDNKPQVRDAVKDFAKKHNFTVDVFSHNQYELRR